MVKKTFRILILLALIATTGFILCLSASAKTLYSGTCGAQGDNLTWTLDNNYILTISGKGEMEDYDSYYPVPWYSKLDVIKVVVINEGVTNIDYYAFSGCSGLTSVTIPSSVISIDHNAFKAGVLEGIWVDKNNPNYCSDESGVLYNKTKTALIRAPENLSDAYAIPDSVTNIGPAAFYWCTGLTSVTIPESVTSIGDWTFANCKSLKSVTIPESVTSIDHEAFFNCAGLTSVTIPDSVTRISSGLFTDCSSLTSITIPSSVTIIDSLVFWNCESLTSITIPDSVTSVGWGAFWDCISLKEVYYTGSFNDFLKISISKKNECLTGAKIYCTDITIAAYGKCGDNLTWTLDDNGVLIISGQGNMEDYGYNPPTAPWADKRENTKTVIVNNGVTSIGCGAFSECKGLTSATISNSVTGIGDYAFYNCKGLTNAAIPSSITSIGDYAFYNCAGLTSVTIPSGITRIGSCAFWYCSGLTSVFIPDSVTSVGWGAFYRCSGLKSVTIGNGVTSISSSAFSGCSGLASVTIPNSVTSIGDGAFKNCESLTDVYYSGNEKKWNSIDIGYYNECLTGAAIHYNSEGNILYEMFGPAKVSVKGEIYNISTKLNNVNRKCTLIAFLSNGRRIVDSQTVDLEPNQTEASVILNAKNANIVKLFIWNRLSGMQPLCEPKEITIPK